MPERKLGFFVQIKKDENFNHRNTASFRNIFLPSIPRPMAWCNTPRASNLANLDIFFNSHI